MQAYLSWYGILFLLLAATGCPNLRAPKSVTITRKGEIAIVKCNDTTKSWHLVCKETSWMGEIGNCTEGKWTELAFIHAAGSAKLTEPAGSQSVPEKAAREQLN